MNIFPEFSRVCFIGDSITHNNGYVSHIVAYYCDNFPQKKVKFYNCGVSGGSVSTLLNIFDEDIAVHRPTHSVIMIGINDSARDWLSQPRSAERYEALRLAFEGYKANLSVLCDKLSNLGSEIILCTQTPYDEYQQSETPALPGAFALLAEYASYVRMFAADRGYELCDFSRYFVRQMQSECLIGADRVHPGELGHYHMAKCFLGCQGLDIGEYMPHPEYMERWRGLVAQLRNIHAAEHLIVGDYSLNVQQRISKVAEYLETGEREYFVKLAEEYLINKPRQSEIVARIDAVMESGFDINS